MNSMFNFVICLQNITLYIHVKTQKKQFLRYFNEVVQQKIKQQEKKKQNRSGRLQEIIDFIREELQISVSKTFTTNWVQ